MRSYGGPYYNTAGVLMKRFEHRHAQREDHVKTQRENSHEQAKDSDLRRNRPCPRHELPVSRTARKKLLLFKAPSLGCFVKAALAN